ncbi:MAG: hypothetical protein Kow0090_13980 [Myxococcota bacterium]
MGEALPFWENISVWRDALICAVISAGALSFLGVWVALKRVLYVPLALSQISSLGVVLAFLLCEVLLPDDINSGSHLPSRLLDPFWLSLLFTVIVAFYFATAREEGAYAVVISYLAASALILILGGFIRQDLHEVETILFGSAVLVETIQILYVTLSAILVFVIHFLFYRKFLFASFDPDSAGAAKIPVARYEVLLYVTFAVMMSVATRAIGALPSFGLTILPALSALRLAKTLPQSFLIAIVAGTASAAFGYYLSWVFELSTGATMVALSAALYFSTLVVGKKTRY